MKSAELKPQVPVNKLPYEKPVLVILESSLYTNGKSYTGNEQVFGGGQIAGPS
jgi:hypothetical protein